MAGGAIPRAEVRESNGEISASVEETNRVRAALGLAPLKTDDGRKEKEKQRQEAETKEREDAYQKAKARVEAARDKRLNSQEVFGTRTVLENLGDADPEDTVAWVERIKNAEKERRERLKSKLKARKAATPKAENAEKAGEFGDVLSGYEVKHARESMGDTPMILTLADKSVLDEKQDDLNMQTDELENVNLKDQEAARERQELKKKDYRKTYDPTDESAIWARAPDAGDVKKKLLEAQAELDTEQQDDLPKIQSDYMTAEEMAQFKKPKKEKKKKKVKKLRKRTDEEDLIDELEREDRADADINMKDSEMLSDTKVDPEARKKRMEQIRQEELKRRQAEDDDPEDDEVELREALARARRAMHEERAAASFLDLRRNLGQAQEAEDERMDEKGDDEKDIVIDDTSVFVRTIRDRGADDDDKDIFGKDSEDEGDDHAVKEHSDDELGSAAKSDSEAGGEKLNGVSGADPAKQEEQQSGTEKVGIASALDHFRLIGDLKATSEQVGRAKDQRLDKSFVDSAGPRAGKEVKLSYVDEFGRELTPREAFRRQCYVFHGKGPSRKKKEKQLKKFLDEMKMKQKSTGDDTPLASVAALKEETKGSGQAFVVLSGKSAYENSSRQLEPGLPKLSKGATPSEKQQSADDAAKGGDSAPQSEQMQKDEVASKGADALGVGSSARVAMSFSAPAAKRPRKDKS